MKKKKKKKNEIAKTIQGKLIIMYKKEENL